MDALLFLAIVAEQFAGREKCNCKWTGRGNYPKQYMKLGLPGGEKYWCEICTDRSPEAVHLDNRTCCTIGCKKISFYTNDGTRNNRICGECRDNPEIVPEDEKARYKDVVNPKCLTCDTRPSYAIVPKDKTYKDVQPVLCKTCVGKLLEDEQNKYKNVVSKRCRECEKTLPNYAIVPEGQTYKDVRPVLCKGCVGKLPKDVQVKYEDVISKKCQHEGCDTLAMYAEDFTGFPRRYCALHAPIGYVNVSHKLCEKCKTNTIKKNKCPGLCARCDPASNYGRYENAVLVILKEKYEIVTQFPVYADGNTRYPLRLDGVIFEDDVIVAIEVDEKKGHNSAMAKELDAARMIVCDAYFEKKYSLPVAWIRIVPDISDKSLGKDKDQFDDIANKIRSDIVDRAMAKIDDLLKNPASGVFYFRQ